MQKKLLSGGILGALLALLIALGIVKPPVTPPSPSPSPTPTASATPEVTPSAFPTPSPASSPVPLCDLPASSNTHCTDNPSNPQFEDAVRDAQQEIRIDGVLVTHTDNPGLYTTTLATILRQRGYCAQSGNVNGIPDEVWIKQSNALSEHYDVVVSTGDIWTHFAARCVPPGF